MTYVSQLSAAELSALTRGPTIAELVELCRKHRSEEKRVTHLHMPFADGIYRFILGRKEIAELERTCGYVDRHGAAKPLGIGAIYGRMARGRAFLPTGEADWSNIAVAEALASEIVERDCIETIRLALIGGGMGLVDDERKPIGPVRAQTLIETYVVGQPLETAWNYAFAILSALISGVEPNEFEDVVPSAVEAVG